jgi:hypothetical protein
VLSGAVYLIGRGIRAQKIIAEVDPPDMGLKDYFHPVEKNADPQRPAGPAMVQHKPRLSNFPSPPSNGLRAKQTSVPFVPHDTESIGVPAPSSSVISRSTASPVSRAFYPGGDSGNGSSLHLTDMKADVMANWLYHRQQEKMWTFGGFDEGVILKKARDEYASCPPELLQNRDGFHDSARKLNVKVGTFPIYIGDGKLTSPVRFDHQDPSRQAVAG